MSNTTPKHVFRAVTGVEEIYPYLVVEVIKRGSTEGEKDKLAQSKRISRVSDGGRTMDLGAGRVEFRHLKWRGDTLIFNLRTRRKSLTCQLPSVTKGIKKPRCVVARGSR